MPSAKTVTLYEQAQDSIEEASADAIYDTTDPHPDPLPARPPPRQSQPVSLPAAGPARGPAATQGKLPAGPVRTAGPAGPVGTAGQGRGPLPTVGKAGPVKVVVSDQPLYGQIDDDDPDLQYGNAEDQPVYGHSIEVKPSRGSGAKPVAQVLYGDNQPVYGEVGESESEQPVYGDMGSTYGKGGYSRAAGEGLYGDDDTPAYVPPPQRAAQFSF